MPVTFAFLLLPQLHIMDIAGPNQTILEAIGYGADFNITYCGIGQAPVCSSGLVMAKPTHFSKMQLQKGDYLIIPGCNVAYLTSAAFRAEKKLLQWIRDCHQAGIKLVSICSAAYVLAECGLLNDMECTTHFKRTQQMQQEYPRVKVKENVLFTESKDIYTSAGVASGIDLTLYIVEQLVGSFVAHKVAREMVIYIRRDGSDAQQSAYLKYRNHIHAGIHKVQDYIVENIHRKNQLHELAAAACMSERNLTRVFRKEAGVTINEYVNSIRAEKVNTLLHNPDLSRKQIARQVGLESERQLLRILQQTG
jgi:transcriptional regulator GlxA family with amidase domain